MKKECPSFADIRTGVKPESDISQDFCSFHIGLDVGPVRGGHETKVQEERFQDRVKHRIALEKQQGYKELGVENIVHGDKVVQDDPVVQFTILEIPAKQALDIRYPLKVFHELFVVNDLGIVVM